MNGGAALSASKGDSARFHAGIKLTSCWRYHVIPLSKLEQSGWGQRFEAVDLAQIWGIQLKLGPRQAFDVWVDDIAFFL
ncbi:hypothetical protein [Sorangium sp. So ce1099]|uniref:hypothetical protein n=1 Tax=Sorangium sp. So ce1099 TaxID=3133331 RepID=UPI003F5FCDD6